MLFHRLSEIRKAWTQSSTQKYQKREGEERKGCPVRVPGFQMVFIAAWRARLKGCAAPLWMGQRQPSMECVTQDTAIPALLFLPPWNTFQHMENESVLWECIYNWGWENAEAFSSAREITKYHRRQAPEGASCPWTLFPGQEWLARASLNRNYLWR